MGEEEKGGGGWTKPLLFSGHRGKRGLREADLFAIRKSFTRPLPPLSLSLAFFGRFPRRNDRARPGTSGES